MSPALLILAKKPVPGRVKTRLCPPCTPHQAALLAAAALDDTLETMRHTAADRRFLAGAGELTATGFETVSQRGDGLGDRIANAFTDVTARSSAPVFQIGMDTPQLRPEDLESGMSALADADAVLGPALDGGWWALGLRDPRHARVLRDVPMSTPDTGRLTEKALCEAGLRVRLLPVQQDVDTVDDARAVATIAPKGRFAARVRVIL